jgi:hypothetical protein
MPDAAPYPVTITLAIVAWLFTSTIDEILKAPYLVYSVNTAINSKDSSLVDTTITLTNITHDKAYKNVAINLIVEQPDEINLSYPHGVQPEQPSWEGDTPPSIGKASFQHTFPIIEPDGQFRILFTHHGPDTRYVSLSMRYPDGNTADTVLLTKPNFTTWLAQYHVILSAAAILALGFLAGVFWLTARKPTLTLEEPKG